MRWVAAAVFGLGLPMLSLMLDHGRHRPASLRLGQMLAWLSVVVLGPLTLDRLLHQTRRSSCRLPLARIPPIAARRASGASAGGHGDSGANRAGRRCVRQPKPVQLPLTLRQPVDVLLKNSQLSGEARIPGEPWLRRDTRWLNIPWLKADLPPGGQPAVRTQLIVRVGGQP